MQGDGRKTIQSGVYEIVNTVSGDRYVGSSVDVDARLAWRRTRLLPLKPGWHVNHSRGLREWWARRKVSADDQMALMNTLELQGRSVKVVTRRKRKTKEVVT